MLITYSILIWKVNYYKYKKVVYSLFCGCKINQNTGCLSRKWLRSAKGETSLQFITSAVSVKIALMSNVKIDGPDEPAQPRSLVRTIALYTQRLSIVTCLKRGIMVDMTRPCICEIGQGFRCIDTFSLSDSYSIIYHTLCHGLLFVW